MCRVTLLHSHSSSDVPKLHFSYWAGIHQVQSSCTVGPAWPGHTGDPESIFHTNECFCWEIRKQLFFIINHLQKMICLCFTTSFLSCVKNTTWTKFVAGIHLLTYGITLWTFHISIIGMHIQDHRNISLHDAIISNAIHTGLSNFSLKAFKYFSQKISIFLSFTL